VNREIYREFGRNGHACGQNLLTLRAQQMFTPKSRDFITANFSAQAGTEFQRSGGSAGIVNADESDAVERASRPVRERVGSITET
jgi:hypothetical protein